MMSRCGNLDQDMLIRRIWPSVIGPTLSSDKQATHATVSELTWEML